jgi:hypothetical protein
MKLVNWFVILLAVASLISIMAFAGDYGRCFTALLFTTNISYAHAATELVMYEGTRIEANKDGSAIKIVAGSGFDRDYEFNGCKLKSDMNARGGRWYGSLGIYDPVEKFLPSFFLPKECNGVSRTVVQEGQIHFDDVPFANEWIRRQQKAAGSTGKTVWTSNGLLISWNTVPNRAQLNVDVWLICVNGQHPTKLEGATDIAVKVWTNKPGRAIHDCAIVGKDVIDQTRSQLVEDWKLWDGRFGSGIR